MTGSRRNSAKCQVADLLAGERCDGEVQVYMTIRARLKNGKRGKALQRGLCLAHSETVVMRLASAAGGA